MDFERPVDPQSPASASHESSHAGASQESPYDFERLERSIDLLLEDHQRLKAEHEALIFELVERQQKMAALESELAEERALRANAVEVVDRVLNRVDQIEQTVFSARAASAADASPSEPGAEANR